MEALVGGLIFTVCIAMMGTWVFPYRKTENLNIFDLAIILVFGFLVNILAFGGLILVLEFSKLML